MKKVLCIILALVLVAALCACGGSGSGSGSGSNSGSASKDLGDFELTMSIHDPSTSNNGKFYQAWADKVNELTDGHVTITIYFSGALASSTDVADMVEEGGCDLGWVYTTFYPDRFPKSDITSFPFLGFGEPVSTTNTLWDLYEEYPELQEEWSDFKLLNMYGNPGMLFASVKGPVVTPDDVKNQVMRTPTGPMTDLMNAMGGSPTVMGPNDMFDSIQKNVISGFVFEPAGVCNFSLQEAAKMTYTNYAMYDAVFALVMNWDTWNSLPEEYQKVISDTTGREGSLAAAKDFGDAADAAKKTIEDAGNTWVDLTDDQIAAFKSIADSVNAKWMEKYTTADFDYAAYAARATEILAQYK
ncbi:MAG: TRAP transporter substrate-binding protein [Oscillospiraceae bacterium]|nr:TRAP transporter substrate-binding protein [Oscillospiraceae bacterium]